MALFRGSEDFVLTMVSKKKKRRYFFIFNIFIVNYS